MTTRGEMAYGNEPQSEIQAQHWLPQCELYQAWSFLSYVRDNQCCGLCKTHVSLAPPEQDEESGDQVSLFVPSQSGFHPAFPYVLLVWKLALP